MKIQDGRTQKTLIYLNEMFNFTDELFENTSFAQEFFKRKITSEQSLPMENFLTWIAKATIMGDNGLINQTQREKLADYLASDFRRFLIQYFTDIFEHHKKNMINTYFNKQVVL